MVKTKTKANIIKWIEKKKKNDSGAFDALVNIVICKLSQSKIYFTHLMISHIQKTVQKHF